MTDLRKVRWKVCLAIALIVGVGTLLPSRFAITVTPSLDKRVYFITYRSDGEIPKSGDYVMIDAVGLASTGALPAEVAELIFSGSQGTIVKRVGCAPGEYLYNSENNYYCNNKFIGSAKDFSLNGTATVKFHYNGEVPAGSLFVVGDHKDSYDSRYHGFVKVKHVIAILHSII